MKLRCQDFVGNFCSQTLTIQVLTTRVLDGSHRADRAVGLIKRKIIEKIRLFKFVKCVSAMDMNAKVLFGTAAESSMFQFKFTQESISSP